MIIQFKKLHSGLLAALMKTFLNVTFFFRHGDGFALDLNLKTLTEAISAQTLEILQCA